MSDINAGWMMFWLDYESETNILAVVKCSTAEPKVAAIATGSAGAACARSLGVAGCAVHVVGKSRAAGGRLAARRVEWLAPQGRRRMARFDHGVPAFTASSADSWQLLASTFKPNALVQRVGQEAPIAHWVRRHP